MNSYLISYDLIGPNRDYTKIIEKIKKYQTWARPLESVWIVKTNNSAAQIRDNLITVLDNNDKLFVVNLSRDAAWKNLSGELSNWIMKNL
jgi:hypothetical protein